jgi:hypothetical protein
MDIEDKLNIENNSRTSSIAYQESQFHSALQELETHFHTKQTDFEALFSRNLVMTSEDYHSRVSDLLKNLLEWKREAKRQYDEIELKIRIASRMNSKE